MRPGVEAQAAPQYTPGFAGMLRSSRLTLCHMRVESKASARCAWIAPPRSPPTIRISGSYAVRRQSRALDGGKMRPSTLPIQEGAHSCNRGHRLLLHQPVP